MTEQEISLDRALGVSECFFHFTHSFGAYVVVIAAVVRGDLDRARLERALRRAQARHPLLRAHVVGPERAMRFTDVGTGAIPLDVETDDGTPIARRMERALVRPLVDDTSPRLRVRWIAPRMSEDANVLIFTIDHCICDGVSVVTLLRELVEDCARDLPERPSLPAIGALEHLLFAQTPPPKLDLKIEKHDVPLVPKRLPPGARSTSLRLVDLTREETLALGARAKSLGTSVNGLLVASALKAAASVSAPGSTSARLGLITNVSLRAAVEPPVSEEAIGNFVSFVHTFHVVDATTDLGALSRECRDAIAARIAAKEAIGRLRVGALRWWERGALKHVATRLRHGIDNAVAVSNTGRLKLSAPSDRVRVEAVYAASAQHVLGSSLAVFAWTIDDVMHLCFGFPSPIVDAEKADAAFAELVRMLRA